MQLSKFHLGLKDKFQKSFWFALNPKTKRHRGFCGFPKIPKRDIPIQPAVGHTVCSLYASQVHWCTDKVLSKMMLRCIKMSDFFRILHDIALETAVSFDVTSIIQTFLNGIVFYTLYVDHWQSWNRCLLNPTDNTSKIEQCLPHSSHFILYCTDRLMTWLWALLYPRL